MLGRLCYRVLPRDGWRFRRLGWKYELTAPHSCGVQVFPGAGREVAQDGWIRLSPTGQLTIARGYAWDGPSGPTLDTPSFMRGSLVHDALYQLMREGRLSRDWRKGADMELRRLCLADGMSPLRAWWVYWGVRLFGGRHAR